MTRSPKGWFKWGVAVCLLHRSPRAVAWHKVGIPPGTDPNKPPYWEIAIRVIQYAQEADRATQGRLIEYLCGQRWEEVPMLWRGQVKRAYNSYARRVRRFNDDLQDYVIVKENNKKMGTVADQWLSGAKDISDYLGISTRSLYRKLKKWDIPVTRIDGKYMARKDRLEKWLEKTGGAG